MKLIPGPSARLGSAPSLCFAAGYQRKIHGASLGHMRELGVLIGVRPVDEPDTWEWATKKKISTKGIIAMK